MVAFIVAPKNSGLQRYREIALSFLDAPEPSRIIEVRGEDVPGWLIRLKEKGKDAIGLTGEDLYREYCLEEREPKLSILKRVTWQDDGALFKKPVLCLLGPKGKTLEKLPNNLSVCISTKYRRLAKRYLNLLERRGFSFKKIYVNGATETSYSAGVADIVIDIVYSGKTIEENGLAVYDKILESDFLILSNMKGDPSD